MGKIRKLIFLMAFHIFTSNNFQNIFFFKLKKFSGIKFLLEILIIIFSLILFSYTIIRYKPKKIFFMCSNSFIDKGLFFLAKIMNLKIYGLISSWDHLTTKRFVDINKFSAAEGMAPYNQALQDMFDQYNIDEANQFMSGMYDNFADAQLPFMVDQLAENLGVSQGSAESILMGGGATDFGLLNDLMNYYEGPLEYSTPEGQALFGDDTIMNLAGGVAAIGKTGKLLRNMKNKLGTGRTAAVLEQLYPGTFGGGLNFPIRFGKDGARLNVGILQGYPTTSKLIRSPLQAYGTVTLPEFVDGE